MPKKINNESLRNNMIALRLTAEEKNKLVLVSKALNLSYTDLFVYCLDFLSNLSQKALKSQNEEK